MIEAGVLRNPDVDAAMMIHILSKVPVESRHLIFMGNGPVLSSNDRFDITVEGVGCHGAMPFTGVDPFVAATHIHQGIMTLNSREIPSDEMLVASVGAINGGREFNVIPSTVTMKGTMRTYNEEIRKYTRQRLEEISRNIAAAFRCTAKIEYSLSNPSLLNDEKLNEEVRGYCEEIFPGEVKGPETTGMYRLSPSEDFSLISRSVPSIFLGISANILDGEIYPMHHPKVQFNEEVIHRAAAVHAYSALRWLQEHGE
jgi:amidohydrolase